MFYYGTTVLLVPGSPTCRGFTITLRHTTLGRNSLDEWSARRRDLYLHNTQHSQQTYIHAPSETRTRDTSKQEVTGLYFMQRVATERANSIITFIKI